ncbi:MAG: L-threonylcarbamoyladenylate synthase type 1 TsaC, partial [Bacteroidia bacterium]|nr:L-threonylcarbamoyladenylate synthase type 1 TsaC [Bacteroidia bacterium]
NIPLYIGDRAQLIAKFTNKKTAAICFGKTPLQTQNVTFFNLSEKENLNEAAINLFSFLRIAGEGDFDVIVSEPLPDKGLGRAINDRLRRAETKI